MSAEPITEDWLREIGFKWHQWDRQPEKQWVLWIRGGRDGPEELGIEVAPPTVPEFGWFCWLRSDLSGRYSRFVHVRHLFTIRELVTLIEAISGWPWDPENILYGQFWRPESAAHLRAEAERRLDRLIPGSHITREPHNWRNGEGLAELREDEKRAKE